MYTSIYLYILRNLGGNLLALLLVDKLELLLRRLVLRIHRQHLWKKTPSTPVQKKTPEPSPFQNDPESVNRRRGPS
jgi:hypothetical protein